MYTINQLGKAIGREYESISNWRKRGWMPYAVKTGRDYLLAPHNCFRVHVAEKVNGFTDVIDAFHLANHSPAVNDAILGLMDPATTAYFTLTVQPVKVRLKDGLIVDDYSVGLIRSSAAGGPIDLAKANCRLLEADSAQVLSVEPNGYSLLVIDLTRLWSSTMLALEKAAADKKGSA